MEQSTNGSMNGAENALDVERIKAMADDYRRNAEEVARRAREFVVRYPVYSVAGAVAAGFLFAKLVRRVER